MPNDTVPAADTGLPAASDPGFDLDQHLSTLRGLTDTLLLAAKGLRHALAEGTACSTDGDALVEFAWMLTSEAHALYALVTGEPPEVLSSLGVTVLAATRARAQQVGGAQ